MGCCVSFRCRSPHMTKSWPRECHSDVENPIHFSFGGLNRLINEYVQPGHGVMYIATALDGAHLLEFGHRSHRKCVQAKEMPQLKNSWDLYL